MTTHRALFMLFALAAGCGAAETAPAAAPSTPYMRPAETGASSAVYMTLRNPSSDTLVLGKVEIDVAGSTMIHRTVERDGTSSMVHEDSVVILPNDSVAFRERGLHIMAAGMRAPLAVGDTVVIRLVYRSSRVDTVRVTVRE